MRRIRYVVASSLDGYIAGPAGEFDWITQDPDVDFAAFFAQFDTFLMGRRTWEIARRGPRLNGRILVFSRTLSQEDHPEITVVADEEDAAIAALRAEPGKDIWLFGGGVLFRSLLERGHVDTVEVSIIPVLLGDGVPLLPGPSLRRRLTLTGNRRYGSGIMTLEYSLDRNATPLA